MSSAASQPQQRVARFSKEFEELVSRLGVLVVGLTGEQFFWKPAPDSWSIAECIDHLNVAGELIYQEIKQSVALAVGNPAADKSRFYDRWIQSYVATYEPPPRHKLPAPRIFRPRVEVKSIPAEEQKHRQKEIIERFVRVHQGIAGLLPQITEDRMLLAARVRSPMAKILTVLLGQSFELVLVHARRHFYQMESVKKKAGFPGLAAQKELMQ